MTQESCIKLVWLTNHFTYYHDCLFRHLEEERDIELMICYKKLVLETHPWKDVGESPYQFRELRKFPLGLDLGILFKALFSKDYFIIAGWDNIMYLVIISLLAIRNRPFGIFTDTPKDFKLSGKQLIKKRWLSYVFRGRSRARLLVTGKIGVHRAIHVLGIDNNKIYNFPFTTNNEIFTPFSDSPGEIKNQIVRFVAVGRIDFAHKGQDIALKAFAGVLNRGITKFKYVVAGVGGDKERMSELIKQLGLMNHVEILGWVEIGDLPRIYNESHFTIHTSHEDPFPNTILESLSCGIPVIGSDAAGSVIERVIPGVNGYIFHDNDVSELEDILVEVFKLEDNSYKELKIRSRSLALQWAPKYNIDVIKNIFIEN